MTPDLAEGLAIGSDGRARCWWAAGNPLNEPYHDTEWGRPVADDRRLFEKIALEGFQSGLSWLTILRKRDGFRHAFAGFDVAAIARFGDDDVERLMQDASIVRNRAKIVATIGNARRYGELVEEFGSLAAYLWSFEPGPDARPPVLDRATLGGIAISREATSLSRDLRRRGWAYVGPTTLYSVMEAMGVVNDHLSGCFAREQVERERTAFERPAAFATPG